MSTEVDGAGSAGGKKAKKGKGKKAKQEGEEQPSVGEAGDKKKKYRRDKPWDTEGIDHWKPVEASKDDVGKKGLLLEESSFATLFPQYREQYLKSVWPDVKKICAEHELKAELNLVEGSMTVKTSRKTWDPYIIIKGRDMLKLLARSVPLPQAQKILQDDMHCDIMKVSGLVGSKERFVKRRQRLVGPNGSTLKAIELLTLCFVLVQGQTVCIMGTIKGIKQVRRIIEDCFKNIHPIYHIKELMIRRELEKDPELKDENWERFLPKFKGVNVKRKKAKKAQKKQKEKSPFPPEPTPRKEDELMASGQYFLNEQERAQKKRIEQREVMKAKSAQRKVERAKEYVAPASASAPVKRKRQEDGAGASTSEIAAKLKEKAAAGKAKKAKTGDALLM